MIYRDVQAQVELGHITTLLLQSGNVASQQQPPGAVRPALPHGQLVVRVVVGHNVQLDLPQALLLRRNLPVSQPLQVAQPVPAQGSKTTGKLIRHAWKPEQKIGRLVIR